MNILEEIAAYTRNRIEEKKKVLSFETILSQAEAEITERPSFAEALKQPGISFICECKKASPSKGLIAAEFPYVEIARDYEAAGAAAISVLTEPKWFLGDDRYLKEITEAVSLPCLRKDFTVDPYMICEAKLLHASAVLFIVSLLDASTLKEYLSLSKRLGLSALVECHDEKEIDTAILAGAEIIGVNNRNLKDFSVDTNNSRRFREQVPKDLTFVAESGVRTAEDVKALKEAGVDAVLVGETMMRAENKTEKLKELRG